MSARKGHRPHDAAIPRCEFELPPSANTWFTVEVSFGASVLPDDVLHINEVAQHINRPIATVRSAVDDGRIARAQVPRAESRGRHARNHSLYIHATPADLALWRRYTFREALAARPDLPQQVSGWRTVVEVARHLNLDYRTAQWRIERSQVPLLEWGTGSPFGVERRYFLPRLPSRLCQPPGAWRPRRGHKRRPGR